MPDRMSPERLAEIRAALKTGRRKISYVFLGRDLSDELDAVTRERDDLKTALSIEAARADKLTRERSYMYRCVECGRWMHKGFILEHCESHQTAPSSDSAASSEDAKREELVREYRELEREYSNLYQAWKDAGSNGPPPIYPVAPHIPGRGDA